MLPRILKTETPSKPYLNVVDVPSPDSEVSFKQGSRRVNKFTKRNKADEIPIRASTKKGGKRKKNSDGTPLQRFKAQTKLKRDELIKAKRNIDKELKAIEKDLGKLKRITPPAAKKYLPSK